MTDDKPNNQFYRQLYVQSLNFGVSLGSNDISDDFSKLKVLTIELLKELKKLDNGCTGSELE